MAEPFAAALRRYIASGYRATEAMKAVWHDVKVGTVARPARRRRGIAGGQPTRRTIERLKRERMTPTPRQRRAMGWNPREASEGVWMRWLPPRKVIQIRQGLEGPIREEPATGRHPATVYRHPFAWVRVDRPSRTLPNPRRRRAPASAVTKFALRRDPSVPVGQPAPLRLHCPCGEILPVDPQAGAQVTCPRCQAVYTSAGWVVRPSPRTRNPVTGFEAFALEDRRGWETAIRSAGGLKISREDRADFAEVPGYLKGYRRGVSPDVLVQMIADERGLPPRTVEDAMLRAFHAPRRRRSADVEDYEALEREAIQTEGRRRTESRPRVRVGAAAFTLRPRSPFKGVIHHVSNPRGRCGWRSNAVRAVRPAEARQVARQYGQRLPRMGYCMRLSAWLELCRDAAGYYLVGHEAPPARRAAPTPVGSTRRAGLNPSLGMRVPRAAAGLKIETRLVRSRGYRPDRLPLISSPADVAALSRRITDSDRERSLALYLNAQNRVIGVQQLTVGARSATLIPVDTLLRTALLTNAAGMILVHNHPSGDVTPSREDIAIYRRLKDAGALVDVRALDAVVVGNGQYRSIEEMGVA